MKKFFLFWIVFAILGGSTMSRSGPDGGYDVNSNPVTNVNDLGETSNHLLMSGGSMSRSGRWLWATGFESGMAEFDTIGTAPTIDTTKVYMGKGALRLQPLAGVGQQSIFQKTLFSAIDPTSQNNRLGVEAMVSFSSFLGGNDGDFYIQIRAYRPSAGAYTQFRMTLKITGDHAANWYIGTGGGDVLHVNVDRYLADSESYYHYIKLVGDAYTGNYVKFIFDDQTFNLSAFPGSPIVANERYIAVQLANINRDAAGILIAKVDNLIITGDEP